LYLVAMARVPFEPVDAALGRAALVVGLRIERERPATRSARGLAVSDPIRRLGNGGRDPMSTQVRAVRAGAQPCDQRRADTATIRHHARSQP
jgi:hypothetical protein